MVIYYDHKRRQCFRGEQPANAPRPVPVSIKDARQAYASGQLTDWNLALGTLAMHDWDMDAVEQYYREQDAQRMTGTPDGF